MEVDPIGDWGALQIARHRFYDRQEGGEYDLDEIARFIHLWKQDSDGTWRLALVISHTHVRIR